MVSNRLNARWADIIASTYIAMTSGILDSLSIYAKYYSSTTSLVQSSQKSTFNFISRPTADLEKF